MRVFMSGCVGGLYVLFVYVFCICVHACCAACMLTSETICARARNVYSIGDTFFQPDVPLDSMPGIKEAKQRMHMRVFMRGCICGMSVLFV